MEQPGHRPQQMTPASSTESRGRRTRSGRGPADRASDIGDDTVRPAHDVVVVVPDASLEPGRAAGRFEAGNETRRGEGAEGLTVDLKGEMTQTIARGDTAHAIAPPEVDRLDAEVVTVPDGLEQREAGGRHPQADAVRPLGDGPVTSLSHAGSGVFLSIGYHRNRSYDG